MKLCMCGGQFVRRGENQTGLGGKRFQCRECRSFVTVRDGRVVGRGRFQVVPWVTLGNPRKPQVRDWRHV